MLDKKIEENFKKWNINTNINKTQKSETVRNQKLDKIINSYLQEDTFEEIVIQNYIKELLFAVKKETKFFYCKDKQVLIGIFHFDKTHGGRVGFVHGGASYFVLLLASQILMDKVYGNQLNKARFRTNYLRKMTIDSAYIVKVEIDQNNSRNILADFLDEDNLVCAKLVCNLYTDLNKF